MLFIISLPLFGHIHNLYAVLFTHTYYFIFTMHAIYHYFTVVAIIWSYSAIFTHVNVIFPYLI